jgi:hypothetical protein
MPNVIMPNHVSAKTRLIRTLIISLAVTGCVTQIADFAHGQTTELSTQSQKVPAGTMLKVVFKQQMDSRITQQGEPFTATLAQDFPSPRQVILPAGTVVRGRVGLVKRPALFSRGGSIALDFDHVMLPTGDLIPLTLNLSVDNKMVNSKRVLYTDPGVGKKVADGFEKGKDTFGHIRDAGIEAGKNTAGGLGLLVTVPATIAGGAVAGTAVTAGKAATALVGRGESVMINPGDEITIDFAGSFNLAVQ